jgi:uncharacterized protein (DUF1778 family)
VYNTRLAAKTERLNLRLTPAQGAVLRRAAEARGESASDYVLRHAVAAAEMDLADRRVFMVDDVAALSAHLLAGSPRLRARSVRVPLSLDHSALGRGVYYADGWRPVGCRDHDRSFDSQNRRRAHGS